MEGWESQHGDPWERLNVDYQGLSQLSTVWVSCPCSVSAAPSVACPSHAPLACTSVILLASLPNEMALVMCQRDLIFWRVLYFSLKYNKLPSFNAWDINLYPVCGFISNFKLLHQHPCKCINMACFFLQKRSINFKGSLIKVSIKF